MRRLILLAILLAVLSLSLSLTAAQRKVVIIKVPGTGDQDIVSYDPARVSEQDVRRWIQLAPEVSDSNFYGVTQSIGDPPYYKGKELNSKVAGRILGEIRNRIMDLDPARYPPDLREVVLYLRRIQRFALWKETQRFAFWQTGDLNALELEFEGINPAVVCGQVLDRIADAPTRDEAAALTWHDWGNCVWNEETKRIGKYPKAAWEKFLANHGIREHYVEEGGDD